MGKKHNHGKWNTASGGTVTRNPPPWHHVKLPDNAEPEIHYISGVEAFAMHCSHLRNTGVPFQERRIYMRADGTYHTFLFKDDTERIIYKDMLQDNNMGYDGTPDHTA